MNLSFIDITIVVVLMVVLTSAAIYTKRFTLSVADFLAANRCARRYLLSVADGMAGVGAISIIAGFEMYYNAGFTAAWWQLIFVIVSTVISLSGWVFYRFRQSRALTLAQFLEMRYSKNFRIFTGLLAYLSGIVNFGIFPAVGARFFIHFCSLPDTTIVYAAVMVVLLFFALFFTFLGGHIAVMVTDFIQGIFTNVMYVVILVVLLGMFHWDTISNALLGSTAKSSMVHPLKTTDAEGFNIWYFLIVAITQFYTTGAWQGNQGFNAAALNAHESRMGKILSTWRLLPLSLFMMVVPVCAYSWFHSTDFAIASTRATEVLGHITNPQIRTQMTTTVALKFILPVGISGALIGIMLSAFIGNCNTYLHSWGSIFIQDVVLPFRGGKPLEPAQHIRWLKYSIFGVAVFIFTFSLVFRQTEYIYMFFMITGAIFVGGAGAVVLGGLYWKRGTTAAAWSAMITGSSLSVLAVILRQVHTSYPFHGKVLSYIASQNGAVLSFYASAIACLTYIFVSVLGSKSPCDLDKLLHRGKYANTAESPQTAGKGRTISALLGITEEFSASDRIIYIATLAWTGFWILLFISGMCYNLMVDVPDASWIRFWKYYTLITLAISAVTAIWFMIGGIIDISYLFKLLRTVKRDARDDGRVIHELQPQAPAQKITAIEE